MPSRKKSARARQRASFEASLPDLADVFEKESIRREEAAERRDSYRRFKSCESKNRYPSYEDAAATRRDCEAHGTYGLNIYHCDNCGGWHLTSKKYESE